MTLRWVRKRDGRRVPFDLRKLADSIAAAARAAGEDARVPAEEIAEVSVLVLERGCKDRIPATDELQDVVEKALLGTNHARTAAAYHDHNKANSKTREELVVLFDDTPVAPDGEPLPKMPGEPWSDGKIVAALERRKIEPRLAEEIAAEVERRVFALGFRRIPIALVREVVNAELAHRGFAARIARPGEVTVPTEEVRRLIVASYVRLGASGRAPAPGGAEAAVGQDVLARFAMAEIYPPRVAEAHAEGIIHVQDIGRPLRFTSAAISLEALKSRASGEPPETPSELGLALARTVSALLPTHARVIGIPFANVFLAPFIRAKDEASRRAVQEFVRALPVSGERPIVRFHTGPVPLELARVAAIGPRARKWKATYGEIAAECDRCADLLAEAIEKPLEIVRGPLPMVLGEPQRAQGMASPLELVPVGGATRAIAAGVATVAAINCARAALRAGPGNEGGLRATIAAAADLAVEAIAAKWTFLESTVYRPKLPLWQPDSATAQADRALGMVDAALATHVVALVGLAEAIRYAGASPDLASEIVRATADRVRGDGARRGLKVRLEEPELERGSRRLADLDMGQFAEAAELLKGAPDFSYSVGLSPALPAAETDPTPTPAA